MKAYFIDNSPMKILLEDVKYFPDEFSLDTKIIPKSYAYDGLSIPRVFQWLVDMNLTQNIKAGLIHDYEFSQLTEVSFRDANARLRRNLDCSLISRWIVWGGVTIFGHFSYHRDSNYRKYKDKITRARESLWLLSLSLSL